MGADLIGSAPFLLADTGRSGRHARRDLAPDAFPGGTLRDFQVECLLQVEPKTGTGAEMPSEAQGRIACYGPLAGQNSGDAVGWARAG